MAKLINKQTVGAFVVGGIVIGGVTYYYLNQNKVNNNSINTNNQLDANKITNFKDIVNDIALKLKWYDNLNIIPTDELIYESIKRHNKANICNVDTIINNIAYIRDKNLNMLQQSIKESKIDKTSILESYLTLIINRIRVTCPKFLSV